MKRKLEETESNDKDNKKRIKIANDSPETCSELSESKNSENEEIQSKEQIIGDKSHQKLLCFKNKVILAPMVRVGTFPMRLMALKYGADIVYNQELIDHKVLRFIRKPNVKHHCIDFIDSSNKKLVFRTFNDEPIIFQIGSCDAVRCLKSYNIISNDVCGIDLNMGCPKKFSMLGGMGAALLKKPEIVEDIIKTLKRNCRNNFSVSCKIRCLEDAKLTLELCKRLESLQINALGIHARYIADRPRMIARIGLIKPLTEQLSVPCIYNGDIYKYADIQIAKEQTGCSSVMIARGAQWNVSLFDKCNKLQPLDRIIDEYVSLSQKYENTFQNSKYVIVKMVCGKRWLCKSAVTVAFQRVKNWTDCFEANKLLSKALKERKEKEEKEPDIRMPDPTYTDPSVFTTL